MLRGRARCRWLCIVSGGMDLDEWMITACISPSLPMITTNNYQIPEARVPYDPRLLLINTVIAKLPVLTKKDARAIRARLRNGPDIPIEFVDDEELLAAVEDSYILSVIAE